MQMHVLFLFKTNILDSKMKQKWLKLIIHIIFWTTTDILKEGVLHYGLNTSNVMNKWNAYLHE